MLSHIDRAFEIKEFSPFGPSQLVCMHDDDAVGQFDSKAKEEKVTAEPAFKWIPFPGPIFSRLLL